MVFDDTLPGFDLDVLCEIIEKEKAQLKSSLKRKVEKHRKLAIWKQTASAEHRKICGCADWTSHLFEEKRVRWSLDDPDPDQGAATAAEEGGDVRPHRPGVIVLE